MNGDWFYTATYDKFGDGGKTAHRSPLDNPITRPKSFVKKCIGKVSTSVGAYICLALTSQVQTTSSIVGNTVSAVEDSFVRADIYRYQRESYTIIACINYQKLIDQ